MVPTYPLAKQHSHDFPLHLCWESQVEIEMSYDISATPLVESQPEHAQVTDTKIVVNIDSFDLISHTIQNEEWEDKILLYDKE